MVENYLLDQEIMAKTKKIKLTKEEFKALLLAVTSDNYSGNVAPLYEDVKIELTIEVENWSVWKRGGQAECWAWGIGQWLQKYRWKNVNGPLRNLKKRLEGLYKK